jgi:Winged helix DNA-binding domain
MTTVAAWLGPATGDPMTPEDLVSRYLAAFGPATVRDLQAWCGLTRLREVVDRMGPRLRRFRTDEGAELVDVPNGLLPDPDTPAPVRFLAEYDNVLLSHADRSRVVDEGDHVLLQGGAGGWTGTLLVDGLMRATWAARRDGDTTVLAVRPSVPLSSDDRADVVREGGRLLEFLAPGRIHDVRFLDG